MEPCQDDAGGSEIVLTMVGKKVALGPIRADLVRDYQRWMNDFRMLRTLRGTEPLPMTEEKAAATLAAISSRPDEAIFTVYEREGLRPVGTTVIAKIDYRNRTGIYGIEIGEASARGRGFGTETTVLMLDYAFTALGLQNVMLHVSELNVGGRRAYERAGFREFGRRRKSRWTSSGFCDDIYMDCLASEFNSALLKAIYEPEEEAAVREQFLRGEPIDTRYSGSR
jgi:RimJ/RimL family protein N-acetyltransferase